METKDIMRSIEETKDLIRRVRTPGGARRYGQPIGSIIVRDAPTPRAPRKGTRRAQSMATDKRRSDAPASRQEAAQTTEGRVAPDADYQAVEKGSEVDFGKKRRNRWWVNSDVSKRQTYYNNEAPFRERVNFEFLKNGTVKEAQKILSDYGVQYKTTPHYKKLAKAADERTVYNPNTGKREVVGGDSYRDFMVSLAESVRLMETEFPGWSKIHGRLYTEGSQKGGAVAYNFPYKGGNDSSAAPKALKDQMRGRVDEIYLAGDRDLKDKPSNTAQTATVFGPQMLTWLRDEFHGTYKPNDRYPVQWNTAGDGLQFLADGSDHRVAQMMNTILHEFGHATAASIAGDISPNLDGRNDVNASHRRWYKEYYSEALMKFYSDNGVFEWTGKQPDYEYLADYEKQLKYYADATENFDASDMEAMRKVMEEGGKLVERAQKSREVSGAKAFVHSGRADDFIPWIRQLTRDGYVKPGSFSKAALMKIAPSTYAATKPVEIEAESWVSYMFDQEATKGASEWGRTMHEMMTWYMDDLANPDFNTTDMEED